MSLRDQILNARDFEVNPVEVPEWNTTVYVRTVSQRHRVKLIELLRSLEANPSLEQAATVVPFVLAMSVCDADGNRVFGLEDIDALADKNGKVLDRIAVEALRVNGLDPEAQAQKKSSSGPTQNESSNSTSA